MKSILSSIFFFFVVVSSYAQISGKVIDNNNEPLPGVNVLVKGTQKGAETDFDGNFNIKNVSGEKTIVVSSIGYKTKIIKVTAPTNSISIVLYEGNELLQEIEINSRNNSFSRKKTAYVAKLPLKDIENTSTYSTVTTEILESQLVTNLDEAMANASGVNKLWESTGRNAGNSTSYYTTRGFSVQPKLVDGVPGLTFSTVDPSYIERIEVLKGPSATLFGSTETSLGGLINVVTKKPFKGEGGSVSYTLGSFGFHRGSLDYNTPLDNNDNVFLRLNASYLTQDSFQDAGFKKTFFVAPSLTFKVNDRLNISLGMELYKSKQTNPSMLFLRRDRELVSNNINELGVDYKKSFTSNDIYLTNPTFNSRLIGDYKISDNWVSKTIFTGSYAEAKGTYQYLYEGAASGLLGLNYLNKGFESQIANTKKALSALDPTDPKQIAKYTELATLLGQLQYVKREVGNSLSPMLNEAKALIKRDAFARLYQKVDDNATQFNIQQNFMGDFKLGEIRNRMVIGLDYLNKKGVINEFVDNPFIQSRSNFPQLSQTLNGLGLTDVDDQVKSSVNDFPYFDTFLTANGKVIPSTFTSNPNYYPLSKKDLELELTKGTPSRKETRSQVLATYVSDVINITPKLIVNLGLRLDYFIQDGDVDDSDDDFDKITLSPSAGVLYQPFKDKLSLFANYQTGFINNDPVNDSFTGKLFTPKPTKAKQFEGGIKTNLFNGRLNLGASYYHIIANNAIATDSKSPRGQTDIEEVVSKGVELEVNANPITGLNLRASFSKNNMEYTDVSSEYSKREILEVKGRRPNSAGADMVYNFWADYKFPEGTFVENFGLGFGFNGASENLTINNAVTGVFTLPKYTIFNAGIYYNSKMFRVGVKANNFTNKIYYTGWSTVNAQSPRSFLGTVTYKF